MQQHMVENRTQAVLLLSARFYRCLNRLRDGNPQGTGTLGVCFEILTSIICLVGRAGIDIRFKCLHDDPPVGLLLIGCFDHVHFQAHIEEMAGNRQRRAPLPCSRLSRQGFGAVDLIVISLGNSRIALVAARDRRAFIFIINMGGGL